jgi:hypothetical protein
VKKLATTILTSLALATIASAGLTPEQFQQVDDWARHQGYTYKGAKVDPAGVHVYLFESEAPVGLAVAPISSDTPDEAINSLIGSASMFRTGMLTIKEMKEEAYKQGYLDGARNNDGEDAYRRGYIQGSRVRASYVGDRQPE